MLLDKLPISEKLGHARGEIEAAESALDAAMTVIDLAPRAEKVTVSQALEQALERLRSARSELAALEEILSKVP
jgi:hypothetical protein